MIFILALCVLDVNAQEKRFENFKIVPELVGEVCGYGRWIVPMDFEKVFDSLKLEYRSKPIFSDSNLLKLGSKSKPNFSDSTLLQRASLALWFSEVPHVYLKENADKGIQEKWRDAVPESLQKRLTKYGEKTNSGVYFKVQMLADCEGNVHSVYFELHRDHLDLIQENELLAISDSLKAYGFNPEDFVFAQSNGERIAQVIDSVSELQNNNSLTKEQREMWLKKLEEVIKPSIPVNYGIINCFEMEFLPDSPKKGKSRCRF